jgi:pimeloyl-ACP methyl ester carboxylesterase
MPWIDSGAASLYWESHGEGPAVAFLHGAGGNALVWWQQAAYFARTYRVILFDHRGFGRSRCPSSDLHPRHFVQDVERVLDAAGVERAALVCQSMGGFAGLPFALSHPDRTSALVLCGTTGGLITDLVLRDVVRLREKQKRFDALHLTLSPRFLAREAGLALLYSQLSALTSPGVLEMAVARLAEIRLRPEQMVDYATPTLVLGGSEDEFFSLDTLAGLAEAIPGAEFLALPGVGHASYFEEPELFNRVVGEFLAKH